MSLENDFDNLSDAIYEIAILSCYFKAKEIKEIRGISEGTVKNYLNKAYTALGIVDKNKKQILKSQYEILPKSYKEKRPIRELSSLLKIESIGGWWITHFSFEGTDEDGLENGDQFDLAYFETSLKISNIEKPNEITGENYIPAIEKAEGYKHQLNVEFAGDVLSGKWTNNNTAHYGLMMLKLHKRQKFMIGKHIGVDSANTVQSGFWQWCKIKNLDNNLHQKLLQERAYDQGKISLNYEVLKNVWKEKLIRNVKNGLEITQEELTGLGILNESI